MLLIFYGSFLQAVLISFRAKSYYNYLKYFNVDYSLQLLSVSACTVPVHMYLYEVYNKILSNSSFIPLLYLYPLMMIQSINLFFYSYLIFLPKLCHSIIVESINSVDFPCYCYCSSECRVFIRNIFF
jgi:hypothetical protein